VGHFRKNCIRRKVFSVTFCGFFIIKQTHPTAKQVFFSPKQAGGYLIAPAYGHFRKKSGNLALCAANAIANCTTAAN